MNKLENVIHHLNKTIGIEEKEMGKIVEEHNDIFLICHQNYS